MGQSHADEKLKAMMPFQVNEALMGLAKPDAKFLHCLPAHRGEEVVDAVLDGPQSVIWDEAEYILHAQKSVLLLDIGQIGCDFSICSYLGSVRSVSSTANSLTFSFTHILS